MTVRHSRGEYDVALEEFGELFEGWEQAYVVTDRNVARNWLGACPFPVFAAAPGETSKSLDGYRDVLNFLSCAGASRDSTVIAVGGGVVGDLAGFAAATYMRGVGLVQVPTSLLAMVDSSVGGKVGINLPEGKNLVGAFYPPVHVSICLETLSTLPLREFTGGTAEIWKVATALASDLLETLEQQPVSPGDTRLATIVMRSVDLKRSVVEADEFEDKGERAVLNFGHTVGHALEQTLGYGTLLHGEAVSIGMVVEAAVGERLGCTPKGLAERLSEGLRRQGLPVRVPKADSNALVATMRRDKKRVGEGLALALLTGAGSCKLVHGVPEPVVLECLQEYI